jgi:hypothetical protein
MKQLTQCDCVMEYWRLHAQKIIKKGNLFLHNSSRLMTTVATNCIYQLELEVEYINIIVLLVKTTIRWIWFAFFIIIVVVVFNILVYSFISLQIIFAVGTTLVLYGPKTTMTEAFKHMQAWSLIQIKIPLEVWSVPYDILFQLHFYKKKIFFLI